MAGSILIVDDDLDILEMLTERLRRHFDEVRKAQDGREALALHEKAPADVIVCDLRMPHMSGQELLQTLRARGDETPFIILTGFADTESAVSALRLGAFDFLVKPLLDESITAKAKEAYAMKMLMKEAENEVEDLIRSGRIHVSSPGMMAAARHVAYLKRLKSQK